MEDFDNSTISTEQGLLQIKPETSRDEQLAFIDTLRGIQGDQNKEIQDTTHALGSDVTPEFGGINGTNSYWLNRYQTPQTEARIATLRTAAQSSALNTALNNYLNRLQEQYSNEYRKASKRSRRRSYGGYGGYGGYGSRGGSGGGSGGGSANSGTPEGKGVVTVTNPTKKSSNDFPTAATTVPIKGLSTTTALDADGNMVTWAETADGKRYPLYKNGKATVNLKGLNTALKIRNSLKR